MLHHCCMTHAIHSLNPERLSSSLSLKHPSGKYGWSSGGIHCACAQSCPDLVSFYSSICCHAFSSCFLFTFFFSLPSKSGWIWKTYKMISLMLFNYHESTFLGFKIAFLLCATFSVVTLLFVLGLAFTLVSGFTVFKFIFLLQACCIFNQWKPFWFIVTVKTMYRVSYIRLHLGFYSVIAAMHIIVCYRNSHKPKCSLIWPQLHSCQQSQKPFPVLTGPLYCFQCITLHRLWDFDWTAYNHHLLL